MAADNIEYQHQTFNRLRQLQKEGTLCDLVLISNDDLEYKVHASVIVAASKSFYNLLMEQGSLKKIRLMNVTGDALKLLVKFIYGENLNTLDELKLVSQTLLKLGMKELFQFIGTSLCDFRTGLISTQVSSTNDRGQNELVPTTPTHSTTNHHLQQPNIGVLSNGVSVPSGDNSLTSVQDCNVKIEKPDIGGDNGDGFDQVKIKTEPVDTPEENANGNCHFYQNNTETCTANSSNSSLKPMALYLNEKHKRNPASCSGQTLMGSIPIFSIRKATGDDVFSKTLGNDVQQSNRSLIQRGNNTAINNSLRTQNHEKLPTKNTVVKEKSCAQKTRILLPKEKQINLKPDGTRVQVMLRPVDNQGNYAIFHASKDQESSKTPSEIKEVQNVQNNQKNEISHVEKVSSPEVPKRKPQVTVKPVSNTSKTSQELLLVTQCLNEKQNVPDERKREKTYYPKTGYKQSDGANPKPLSAATVKKSEKSTSTADLKALCRKAYVALTRIPDIAPGQVFKIKDVVSLQKSEMKTAKIFQKQGGSHSIHSNNMKSGLKDIPKVLWSKQVIKKSGISLQDVRSICDQRQTSTTESRPKKEISSSNELEKGTQETDFVVCTRKLSDKISTSPMSRKRKCKDVGQETTSKMLREQDADGNDEDMLIIDLKEDKTLQPDEMNGTVNMVKGPKSRLEAVNLNLPSVKQPNRPHRIVFGKKLNFVHGQNEVAYSPGGKIEKETEVQPSASTSDLSRKMNPVSVVTSVRSESDLAGSKTSTSVQSSYKNLAPSTDMRFPLMVKLPNGNMTTIMIPKEFTQGNPLPVQKPVKNNNTVQGSPVTSLPTVMLPQALVQGNPIILQQSVKNIQAPQSTPIQKMPNGNSTTFIMPQENTQVNPVLFQQSVEDDNTVQGKPVPNTTPEGQNLLSPNLLVPGGQTVSTGTADSKSFLQNLPVSESQRSVVNQQSSSVHALQNIAQTSIIGGTQVGQPQLLITNLSNNNNPETLAVRGIGQVYPGQEFIVQQTPQISVPTLPGIISNTSQLCQPTQFIQIPRQLTAPHQQTNLTQTPQIIQISGQPGQAVIPQMSSLVTSPEQQLGQFSKILKKTAVAVTSQANYQTIAAKSSWSSPVNQDTPKTLFSLKPLKPKTMNE